MNKENKYNKVIKILETTLPSTPPLSAQAKMSLMAAILHSEFKHFFISLISLSLQAAFNIILKPSSTRVIIRSSITPP